jgi:DHHC palmitoyltransferase
LQDGGCLTFTCRRLRCGTHADSQCDNCVDACDHHCQWVNNCIGRRNYTSFLVLLITAVRFPVLHDSQKLTTATTGPHSHSYHRHFRTPTLLPHSLATSIVWRRTGKNTRVCCGVCDCAHRDLACGGFVELSSSGEFGRISACEENGN